MTRSRSRYPRRTSSTISPSGRPVPGHAHDRLVLARVERLADAPRPGHALALEEAAQLAVDGGDAVGPRVVLEVGGSGLDGAVEVVGERQHLADQVLAREAELRARAPRRSGA